MSKYEIKGATPVKIKLRICLTLNKKLNNIRNNPKNKTFSFSINYALYRLSIK